MESYSNDTLLSGMHELDRIDHALATKQLDAHLFERCVQDLLIEVYPGLSPIPGGTDWGRDADVHDAENPTPGELLITSSRTVEGVRKNLISSLESRQKREGRGNRLILANLAILNERQRDKLRKKAREYNYTIEAIYDRFYFASRLRRDPAWRSALLGLPGNPISISKIPSSLAESPWRCIRIRGREKEIDLLRALEKDAIIYGSPGVGKTRLAAELPDSVFAEVDSASDQLADDIRWLRPNFIVLDDAAQRLELVRYLRYLRQTERELDFKIVAICWPDEIDEIRDRLPDAQLVEVPLLERKYIDKIIVDMGIVHPIAREEILDQAEGRPGWAIALADILTKTLKWESLADGKVLLGEVERYLRRAQVEGEAIDLLTIVAALGGITEGDIGKLAAFQNLPVPATRRTLLRAAHSGLLDAQSNERDGGQTRRYMIRPPMLADALVAEHVFRAAIPTVNLVDLAHSWPGAAASLARSAIVSTLMGANARHVAASLIRQNRADRSLFDRDFIALARLYACIDEQAGREVLGWAIKDVSDHHNLSLPCWQYEGIAELAGLLARRYLLGEAITLILELAIRDSRPTRQWPQHPLRVLEELVSEYQSDFDACEKFRHLLVHVLNSWATNKRNDPRVAEIYASVISLPLSIRRSARYLDPADRRKVNIVEAILSPDGIRRIYETIWPQVRSGLLSASPEAIRSVIDEVVWWLRIGYGFERPYGIEYSKSSMQAAKQYGLQIVQELVDLTRRKSGLAVYLCRSIAPFGIDVDVDLPADTVAFFTEIDWKEVYTGKQAEVVQVLKSLGSSWANENPRDVMARLVKLKYELELAGLTWPNRIEWICKALADCASDFSVWIEAALEARLFPDAEPFIRKALESGCEVPVELLDRCLADQVARWRLIDSVLSGNATKSVVRYVMCRLQSADFPVFEALAFRNRLPVERQVELLKVPPSEVRGVVAFALARPALIEGIAWPPETLEARWLEAVLDFEPMLVPNLEEYKLRPFFGFLAERYPNVFAVFMRRRLRTLHERNELPQEIGIDLGLYLLQPDVKKQFLREFGDVPLLRWFLVSHICGSDVEWLGEAIDEGLIGATEALRCRSGFGLIPEPSIEDLARVLVPRGVAPADIASIAEFGVAFGEESERLHALVAQFQALAASDDPNVAAVGRAGVEMYTRRLNRALEVERIARIRGEL